MNLDTLLPTEILALTVYGEARGESIEGQAAVANVIMNRAGNDIKKIKEVCFKPYQFSCWNQDDPNYPKLLLLADQITLGKNIMNTAYRQCDYISMGVIAQRIQDNTNKSKFYMATNLFNSDKRPKWARVPLNEPKIIGNHTFFNV